MLFLLLILGPSFREVWGETMMDDDQSALLIYKVAITRNIISGSNTVAFIPFGNTLNFCIAQEVDNETQDFSFLTVTVPAQNLENNFNDQGFVFNNVVWNAIAEASLSPANHDNEVYKSPSEASFWQLSNLTYEGSELYTMFSPEKWAEMMDPEKIEPSLRAIRDSIIDNVA